jgi:hypothetical protein
MEKSQKEICQIFIISIKIFLKKYAALVGTCRRDEI